MTPIEATVRLMETLAVTGKLSECNVGQTYDLAEQFMALFSAQKPKRQRAEKPEPEKPKGPTHIDMNELDKPKETGAWD